MKKIQIMALVGTILWNLGPCSLLCAPALWAGEKKPLLFVNTPYPPYSVGDYGRPDGGSAVAITAEIFRRLDIPVRQELHPWRRVLKMAETGQADGITLLMKTEQRTGFLSFTEPLFMAREVFYYRPDRLGRFQWEKFVDLKPYRIGLVEAYGYSPDFLEAVKQLSLDVEYAASDRISFQKLHVGRIDLYLCNADMGNSLIAKNPKWQKSFLEQKKPVRVYPDYMAISRRSPAQKLLPRINQVILEMKADGTVDRLLNRP